MKSKLKSKLLSLLSIERQDQIVGSTSEAETQKLANLAVEVSNDETIVEIGNHQGRSVIIMAKAIKSAGKSTKIYAVDPHVEFKGVNGRVFGPLDLKAMYSNIVIAGVGDLIFKVALASNEAASAWTNRNIGLIFIDGDHSYEGVKLDFESWFIHIANGGKLAFHDSTSPGVSRLIGEISSDNRLRLNETCGELTIFQKITV